MQKPSPAVAQWCGATSGGAAGSVFPSHGGPAAVAAAHLLQHGRQLVQVAVREVLRLPQVQNHTGGTGLGGKVVQVPGGESGGQRANVLKRLKKKMC